MTLNRIPSAERAKNDQINGRGARRKIGRSKNEASPPAGMVVVSVRGVRVSLDDALRVLVVMAEKRDPRFERAAARFAARVRVSAIWIRRSPIGCWRLR